MALLQQGVAYNRTFLLVQSSDHITGLTGATPTVTLSKNGAAFGAAGGAVSEIGSGWYYLALNTTDTGTVGDLAYHVTAASADPCDFADEVGFVPLTSNIKKNTATNGFTFVMTDATTHAPKTALTVTATRSLDGAAFAACTNSVTEVATGTYTINLSAADTNANHIMLRFTATGADDLNIAIITQP